MRKHIKAYLITDPFLYPKYSPDFRRFYKEILEAHSPSYAVYRDKTMQFAFKLLEVFLELNREYNVVSLLNSHIDLALDLGFDGVHCNGLQLDKIQYCKERFQHVFYSAHDLRGLEHADRMGASGITISPIFETPNKGVPLGVDFLKQIDPKKYQADIFALGGIITKAEVDALKETQVQNFASIRYFLS